MEKVKRYDINRIDKSDVKQTVQGFIEVKATTARTGVQTYRQAGGGVLLEYRPENEVFSAMNMDSIVTSPVTNGHPPQMVNPENSKKFMVGFPVRGVKKVSQDEEHFIETRLTITDARAIDAINAGKAQVSNGYSADLDWSEGMHKGQRYDAIQRNLKNNHIAIVWNARGGPKVRLHMDEDDGLLVTDFDNMIELVIEPYFDFDLDDPIILDVENPEAFQISDDFFQE